VDSHVLVEVATLRDGYPLAMCATMLHIVKRKCRRVHTKSEPHRTLTYQTESFFVDFPRNQLAQIMAHQVHRVGRNDAQDGRITKGINIRDNTLLDGGGRTQDLYLAPNSISNAHWICETSTGDINLNVAVIRGPPYESVHDELYGRPSVTPALEHALSSVVPVYVTFELIPEHAKIFINDAKMAREYDLPRLFTLSGTAFLVAKKHNPSFEVELVFATSLHYVQTVIHTQKNLNDSDQKINVVLQMTHMWVDLRSKGARA
jgi:hypothetical protein